MSGVLHKQLAVDLRKRITSGVWPVGERVPAETELSRALGVSRATVRLALSELEEQGLVERRKRVGTTVISDKPGKSFQMVTDGIDEVLSLGRDTFLDISDVSSVPDGSEALLDGLSSETGHWLKVTGTRRLDSDSTSFNWSQIFVTGRYAGIEPALGKRIHAVHTVIETTFGVAVAEVNQSVAAIACPAVAAKEIGLPRRTPVLHITARLYDANKRLIEVSSALFDPARFQVNTSVRISG